MRQSDSRTRLSEDEARLRKLGCMIKFVVLMKLMIIPYDRYTGSETNIFSMVKFWIGSQHDQRYSWHHSFVYVFFENWR